MLDMTIIGPTPLAITLVAFGMSLQFVGVKVFLVVIPVGLSLLPWIFTVPAAVASPMITWNDTLIAWLVSKITALVTEAVLTADRACVLTTLILFLKVHYRRVE